MNTTSSKLLIWAYFVAEPVAIGWFMAAVPVVAVCIALEAAVVNWRRSSGFRWPREVGPGQVLLDGILLSLTTAFLIPVLWLLALHGSLSQSIGRMFWMFATAGVAAGGILLIRTGIVVVCWLFDASARW